MAERSKEEQRERHERTMRKHHRTREEERRIREAARERRAEQRGRGPRRRGWEDASEDEPGAGFERIARAPRGRPGRAAPAGTPLAAQEARSESGDATALVVAVHRAGVRVRGAGGVEREAQLARGALGPLVPAVGDRARIVELLGGGARVVALEPRRTVLSRPDPADPRRERVLAANVDQALIVGSARRPELRPGLVERVLLALARGGVAPRVCVNKLDLLAGRGERAELEARLSAWRARGIPCHALSAATGEGLAELSFAIRGATCVLVGHSGVGKSSLANALFPAAALPTAAVRRRQGKGRHTTSSSHLLDLPCGTRLIDTPGIRAFGLWGVGRRELDAAFADVVTHAVRCRFADCSHGPEPSCAVRAAVLAGHLSPSRAATYADLRAELSPPEPPQARLRSRDP